MVVKVEDQNENAIILPYKFIKSSVSTNYQSNLELEKTLLQKGKYILLIEALWNKAALNTNY